jgi:hypothetical protein
MADLVFDLVGTAGSIEMEMNRIGPRGVGIADVELNADYTLTVTLTDGTSYTTESIRGEQGPQGIQGETGPQGPQGEKGKKGDKGDAGGVTGVKGNAESTYRTGNVNLTPANIGAAASSHSHTINNISNWRDYCTLTLLWTNSSPGSNFNAQTIYLSQNAGNFKLLLIDVRNATSNDNHFFQFMNVGVTNKIANPGYSSNAIRTVTISGTGVTFSAGQHGSSSTANGYAIPYKIWGLI